MLHESAHVLAGNKRYKLERNLDHAVEQGLSGIVSFGGAWSNHVAALAHATRLRNLQCVCVIRGEPSHIDNPTLSEAQRLGMRLEFVNRAQYRQRYHAEWLESLGRKYPNYLILPEGGSNQQAVESCQDMLDSLAAEWRHSIDVVACPVGTGATLAGIRLGMDKDQQARGYLAVRDPDTLSRIQQWSTSMGRRSVNTVLKLVDASAPGYARLDANHYHCVNHWFESTGILLDPVYTVKMVSRVSLELGEGLFSAGTRILLIHTGGYQGWRGWQNGARHNMLSRHLAAPVTEEIKRVQCPADT